MKLKEIPLGIKDYYKNFKQYYKDLYEATETILIQLKDSLEEAHNDVYVKQDIYKSKYGINLLEYKEYTKNKYSNGVFLSFTKAGYLKNNNNFELFSVYYDLYKLAKLQKDIHDHEKRNELNSKLKDLKFNDYKSIIKNHYTEVQKQLILEGNGYSLGKVGWICINRCVIEKARPMLDFSATKKRKADLIKQGAKIYNKEEADWCKERGINYKAADVRVYKKDDHCYEIPLISCKLENGGDFKFTTTDYRGTSVRGKSNEDLLKECNNDVNKICNLDVDLRTKLTLCEKVNKILYNKYIRNENQQPSTHRSSNRKD